MSLKNDKNTSRKKYVRRTNGLTLEKLKQLEAKGPPPGERPEALPLEDIHIAPLVFQWRPANEELAAEEQLMSDLVRFIEGDFPPRALDPIVVTAIGKQFFVIDGHHRLDAYHIARWEGPVPVRYYSGSLKEAETTALKLNVKNKLPMTRDARSEAAWRMLVAGARDPAWKRTQNEIMRASNASRSTVKRMARALNELGSDAFAMTWAAVRRMSYQEQQGEMNDEGREAWKEQKARKLADYLAKGPSLTKDPEITAWALEMVSSLLPGQLTSQWPAEARENLTAHVEEVAPDKAGALVEVLDALDGWESL